jgi:hypothetical protein
MRYYLDWYIYLLKKTTMEADNDVGDTDEAGIQKAPLRETARRRL